MKTKAGMMAVTAMFAGTVFAAPAWTTGIHVPANWTMNPSNLLAYATRSGGVAALDDRAMTVNNTNGNIDNNAVVTWTLAGASTITEIKIYSCYGDAGRDGIGIAKIEVKYDGSSVWTDLGAPAVSYGMNNSSSGKYLYAFYSDHGADLATNVIGVRLTFGMQDNNKTGYGEIEVIGFDSLGWPLEVTPIDEEFGAITVTPAAREGGYYDAGTVVTVSIAVSNEVEFLRWKGDPPPGAEQSATVNITMNGLKSLTASLFAPYLLYKNGKLTDGKMVMSASGETNAISVTGVSGFGDNSSIDLTKTIKGGGKIISVGGFGSTVIKSIVFPTTLETIGHRAFVNCTSLTDISPMFPENLTSLGGGAFADCGKFTGNVRLGFATDGSGNPLPFTFAIHDTTRGLQFQADAVGPNVLLGPGVTAIPDNTFSSSGNITNLYLGANVSSIGLLCFNGIGASKGASVTFAGDMPAIKSTAFGSSPTAYRIRFFTSVVKHPNWNAFVTDPTKVTPWSQLDAAKQANYWTNFPKANGFTRPYGMTTAGAIVGGYGLPANEWVFTDKSVGMQMFVK